LEKSTGKNKIAELPTMQISPKDLNSYKSQKAQSLIWSSKCFFLIQLYILTPSEIGNLKQITSSLGLRLIRFPIVNWRKASKRSFPASSHLPVQISNYALVGENRLPKKALATLNTIIQQRPVILIFGYQENTWFNIPRLLKSTNLDASQDLTTTLQIPFQTLYPSLQILRLLLQNLELDFDKLK
jgi:hypothetical protein